MTILINESYRENNFEDLFGGDKNQADFKVLLIRDEVLFLEFLQAAFEDPNGVSKVVSLLDYVLWV